MFPGLQKTRLKNQSMVLGRGGASPRPLPRNIPLLFLDPLPPPSFKSLAYRDMQQQHLVLDYEIAFYWLWAGGCEDIFMK